MNEEILLKEGSLLMGFEMDEKTAQRLLKYLHILWEWNKRINLTAEASRETIIIKHFLDSLGGINLIKEKEGKLADVGSGAGFPGMVMALCIPRMDTVLIESIGKKGEFLRSIIRELGMENASVEVARAEDLGRNPDFRECFDYTTIRAVSSLRVIVEYCLPLLKKGGFMLAYKGPGVYEEIKEAGNALEVMGGSVVEVYEYELPYTGERRSIALIEKIRESPRKYPRRAGIPQKRPL
ncbi:MAG: 16S rRNA (guanine(527)-N(7))-methyltransferase RsmG [Clostridia bacterium]|nr:16S rRNA (guanine(527)-N(7))-methyltransferase RsmG [Clostridia bacterium]